MTSHRTNRSVQEKVPAWRITYAAPEDPWARRLLIQLLEHATGRRRIEKLYQGLQARELAPTAVWGEALRLLRIGIDWDEEQIAKIPADGPLLIIANHPFGVVDGLIMGHLAARVRAHFGVLVNAVLCRQDERLDPFLLPIDFNESRNAIRTNLETRAEAQTRLDQGQAIVIFPAGGVATAPGGWGKAEDLVWKRFTAKMIQRSKATVIPVFVHGQNSRIFHLVSQFSAALRLGLLLREVKNKRKKTVSVTIGDPIPFTDLAHLKDKQLLLDHLRDATFALGENQA